MCTHILWEEFHEFFHQKLIVGVVCTQVSPQLLNVIITTSVDTSIAILTLLLKTQNIVIWTSQLL